MEGEREGQGDEGGKGEGEGEGERVNWTPAPKYTLPLNFFTF